MTWGLYLCTFFFAYHGQNYIGEHHVNGKDDMFVILEHCGANHLQKGSDANTG
jgi:hypothetical protein